MAKRSLTKDSVPNYKPHNPLTSESPIYDDEIISLIRKYKRKPEDKVELLEIENDEEQVPNEVTLLYAMRYQLKEIFFWFFAGRNQDRSPLPKERAKEWKKIQDSCKPLLALNYRADLPEPLRRDLEKFYNYNPNQIDNFVYALNEIANLKKCAKKIQGKLSKIKSPKSKDRSRSRLIGDIAQIHMDYFKTGSKAQFVIDVLSIYKKKLRTKDCISELKSIEKQLERSKKK